MVTEVLRKLWGPLILPEDETWVSSGFQVGTVCAAASWHSASLLNNWPSFSGWTSEQCFHLLKIPICSSNSHHSGRLFRSCRSQPLDSFWQKRLTCQRICLVRVIVLKPSSVYLFQHSLSCSLCIKNKNKQKGDFLEGDAVLSLSWILTATPSLQDHSFSLS